ncbi:M91 family zinc metallopeptidase [Streptomyces hesseae]|uniref:M91 family zinc metallopeptidase n=1 Tax=Streptomyces hesseae TaxID=3075519 RepID=A0ABU2SKE7_9ACTN|nr:M91 family zinc metallopeptidase [Streptomyces sp. DSM 40473]MDT0449454.1 M91 family zinc metallopeptidase [Streptomyces sp. DSM 40473]
MARATMLSHPADPLDQAFLDHVDDLLTRLEAVPSGKRLVDFFGQATPLPGPHGFGESAFTARYESGNSPASISTVILSRGTRSSADTRALTDETPTARSGLGYFSYIEFNPRFAVVQDRVILAPEIVLGHELIHAAHIVAGSMEKNEEEQPYLAGLLNGALAFDTSPLEEIVTHGNPIALEWLFGTTTDTGTGQKALRNTPGQLRSIEVIDRHLAGTLDAVEAARAQRIRTQRMELFDISERRLAEELNFAARPTYGPLAKEDQAAGIWKQDWRRPEGDNMFRNPIPNAPKDKVKKLLTTKYFDRFPYEPDGFLADRGTAEPHVRQELDPEHAERARRIIATHGGLAPVLDFARPQPPVTDPGNGPAVIRISEEIYV